MIADALPPTLQAEYALVHDARAVYDVATVDLSDYMVDDRAEWIVALVTPDPDSGSATVPGAYIDAETGAVVAMDSATAVIIKRGRWKTLAAGDPAAPTSGAYAWSDPMEATPRRSRPEDIYSPFAHGGTILFRPDADAEGEAAFLDVCLLFPGWGDDAAAAFAAHQDIPDLHGDLTEPAQDVSSLERMIEGRNNLLAVLAMRKLLASGAIGVSVASQWLNGAVAHRAAVFAHLMVRAMVSRRAIGVGWSDQWIRDVTDLEGLETIALGAFAAATFADEDPSVRAAGEKTLTLIGERLAEEGQVPRPGSPLHLMLLKLGLQQPP